jgi:hypothetical protein
MSVYRYDDTILTVIICTKHENCENSSVKRVPNPWDIIELFGIKQDYNWYLHLLFDI